MLRVARRLASTVQKRKAFFFEKKNQKTSAPALNPPDSNWAMLAGAQEFFGSFFQKVTLT
jgi:hypothetical protein